MSSSTWTDADTARALQIWAQYQKEHDVSDRIGQAVGIDPATGRVWFGESALDIVQQMQAEGLDTPLYFLRVGFDYYLRKGSRRHRRPERAPRLSPPTTPAADGRAGALLRLPSHTGHG